MLRKTLSLTSVILTGTLLQNATAWAKPEYAVRHGYVSCVQCHTNPMGGGPRNINGKMYGAHGKPQAWASDQDLASFDGRATLLLPSKPTLPSTSSGLAVMSAIGTANVPIQKDKTTEEVKSRFVGSFGFGGLAAGLREAFLLYNLEKDAKTSFFKNITVGRFQTPFGLLTDEHRTYTKLQTRTGVNNFEFGAALSGDPTYKIHYDLGVATGFQNGGNFVVSDLPYMFFANIRWNPPWMPFFIGLSGSSHRTLTKVYRPYAYGFYGALSLDRLTHHFLHGSIQSEVTWAHGFNDNPPNDRITYFIPTSQAAWQSAIANSRSLGWYLLAQYDFTEAFALHYKYDLFSPDSRYRADAFTRHSVGARYFLTSSVQIIARYERSLFGKEGMQFTDSQATRNAVLGMFQFTL